MNREFVPYELALKLKQLGFDEPCIATHGYLELYINTDDGHIKAPLYQQAFRWFREKHGLIYSIGHMGHSNTWAYEIINISMPGPNYGYAQTYEEAEQACLNKLIEIVKDGKYV